MVGEGGVQTRRCRQRLVAHGMGKAQGWEGERQRHAHTCNHTHRQKDMHTYAIIHTDKQTTCRKAGTDKKTDSLNSRKKRCI